MTKPPVFMYNVSKALAEVMVDIGVNERLVMKKRRAYLLRETLPTIFPNYFGIEKMYHFGSQSEGSTTIGLKSDMDMLNSFITAKVIQSISEWQDSGFNLLMIQNENISPGYCYLQLMRYDEPIPATITVHAFDTDTLKHCATGCEGKLLVKNTYIYRNMDDLFERHGPAFTPRGVKDVDLVGSYHCKSSPHQVTSWLQRHREGNSKWPTEEVLNECRNAGCFVVAVGGKVHSPDTLESELEWRISTSLQERYLMFSLNITQLMCYILMKMILRTFVSPHVEGVLSSFMCKNVLLYCVANSSHDWHTGNLLAHLHLCLFMLKECIKQRNCPHFIIPENNLLVGHMTERQRGGLLDIINNLMANEEELLYKITIGDLGTRLQMKLNTINDSPKLLSPKDMYTLVSYCLVQQVSEHQGHCLNMALEEVKQESLENAHQYVSDICKRLIMYRSSRGTHVLPNTDTGLLHIVCELYIPILNSMLGSMLACACIDNGKSISDRAIDLLKAGKDSDVLSGRLKLASVLYCAGNMERANSELFVSQHQFDISKLHTVCGCSSNNSVDLKMGGLENFEFDENALTSNLAFCTRFLRCELNCVPHELRFEILRSYIEEDRQMRTDAELEWMDYIIVDAVPYLYFLQYKTYGHLLDKEEQQTALLRHAGCMKWEPNLGHPETDFNLLGQCFEQENNQVLALQCYIASLSHRRRNNAARFLMCIQLFKLWKRENWQ